MHQQDNWSTLTLCRIINVCTCIFTTYAYVVRNVHIIQLRKVNSTASLLVSRPMSNILQSYVPWFGHHLLFYALHPSLPLPECSTRECCAKLYHNQLQNWYSAQNRLKWRNTCFMTTCKMLILHCFFYFVNLWAKQELNLRVKNHSRHTKQF